MQLVRQVEEKGLGEILHAPCDVLLSREDVLQPDILFVRKERLGIIAEANIPGAPDLVVEILSPDTIITADLDFTRLFARMESPAHAEIHIEAR